MNILLTNDDGYNAEGILVLQEVLSKEHNVYILAPKENCSATSHHITMRSNLEILQISEKVYACSGFPSDCSFVALKSSLFSVKFDCVISGINNGSNIGTDIVYSGTCAAAREASLLGLPSIAVSLDYYKQKIESFYPIAEFVRKNLSKLIRLCENSSKKVFVNINALGILQYKGVVFTNLLSERKYDDAVNLSSKENGFTTSNREGPLINPVLKETDEDAVHNGFISISLVLSEPVCSDSVEEIEFSV